MNNLHYLSQQGPEAQPHSFHYEGREWWVFPLSTKAIAAQLERWVVQEVMRNSEARRPDKDDPDPIIWRTYGEWSEQTRRDIDRGLYGAMAPGWYAIVEGTDRGFAEMLFQCVRFKEKEWTREHVARLMANEADYNAVYKIVMGLNHPKAPSQEPRSPPEADATTKNPSAGTSS